MTQSEQSNELLCVQAQQGDAAAQEQLVLRNLDFIRGIANKLYFRLNIKKSLPHLDPEDLVQEGCIGLLTAIEKYDPARGMKFLTFARKLIREAIIDALRSQSSPKDGSEHGGVAMSLDAPMPGDDRISLGDAVAHIAALSPEQAYMIKELRAELRAAMRLLPKRERMLILYHYGFPDPSAGPDEQKAKHTLTETAQHFHLTEHRAKAFLRHALTGLKRNMPQYYISRGKQFPCPEVVKPVLHAMERQS